MGALVGVAAVVGQQDAPAAHEAHRHPRPDFVPAAVSTPAPLPTTGWTVSANSEAGPGQAAAKAIDGDPATAWRTADGVAAPHTLLIDTHNRVAIGGLTYLPPTGTGAGRVGQYTIEVSDDGTTFGAPVATGTFADDATLKTATFGTVITRYVRLTAVTAATGTGPVGGAEVGLLGGTDPALPRTGWTVAADSQETVGENGAAGNVLDGNTATIWHTAWSQAPGAPLPHTITVDMHATNLVSGLAYLPRQGGVRNGNIGQYRIETSTDGAAWGEAAATGTFADVSTAQTTTFAPALARYVRLTALTEAGNRGPWSSAAELNLLGRPDPSLSRTGWTVAADSQEAVGENGAASNVLDGNPATIWHSRWSGGTSDPLPHTLTVDLRAPTAVGGLSYLPRPASVGNGRIGRYTLESSTDGTTWAPAGSGTFADNGVLKTAVFPTVTARYVRLTAHTEAGNRGPWTSAAEIGVLGPTGSVSPDQGGQGSWGAPVGFPLVPAAAVVLPNGKILTWSSYRTDSFGGSGLTITATYDPSTGTVTQRSVTETGHDMFCPGISILADGKVIVTGGDDSAKTSIYDPATDAWTTGPQMNIPRGYQSSVTTSEGKVFAIGGSWSGGYGGKDGEIWSAASGWQALPGAPVAPMLTADAQGIFRQDNHAWLFAWTGGSVLQAGPSKAMNWYTTTGTGGTTPAGLRGDDSDAMDGNAVMFDAGKILTVGGSPDYQDSDATTNAYVVTLGAGTTTPVVRKVAPMANARAFHNSVALPDGKVAVFGGQSYPVPFSDNTAVLSAELWDPATETFTTMASAVVPRTYHSVALLMPDGRVFTGGGGLCGTGCATNHFDGEIFTPPNLLNPDGSPADRPTITAAPATAANGAAITVTTDRAVTGFSIVRLGSTTHSVNTDQRRIALAPTPVTGGYQLTIPADPGVAVPGHYMLFALDAEGVPSVAKIVQIG